MKEQNYQNHRRLVPLYHMASYFFVGITLLGSLAYTISALISGEDIILSLLILGLAISLALLISPIRAFPIKAQDRAIRAEENLRHYVLTGKLLDPKLRMSQIVALRFADDNQFPSLCQRAVAENLSNDNIKRAVTNWRADHHRA